MDSEELQNRRQFFKKAAQKVLPMIGTFIAAPTIISTSLSSCTCDGCEASCMDDCEGGCQGSCEYGCTSSCYYSSSNSGTDDCANNCSSSCKSTCSTTCDSTCKDTCKSTCEGSATGKPTKGTINGHEYVDLGLSVLWATCNIGANKPEEYGDDLPFVFADRNYESEQQYYRDVVNLNLKPEDSICGTYLDFARKEWGDKWRMPSKDDLKELSNNCRGKYSSKGVEIVSKINGNSIFIPWNDNNNYAILWTGTIAKSESTSTEGEIRAYVLHKVNHDFLKDDVYIDVHDFEITRYKLDGWYSYYSQIKEKIRPVIDRDSSMNNCNGSCTANCSSDCSVTCKNECSGTCKGSCGNNCTGGCNTTCTKSCADTCSSNCTTSCSSSCSSTCKGTCSSGCGTGCSGACSGCTRACQNSCEYGCTASCSNDCSSGCSGSCGYGCSGSCVTGCSGSCSTTCKGTCFGSCSTTCEGWTK